MNNLIRATNNAIKNIATSLEINKNLTTYSARHSWATELMRNGAPVSLIQKQLGHKNSATTDGYLENFDDEIKKEFQLKINNLNR